MADEGTKRLPRRKAAQRGLYANYYREISSSEGSKSRAKRR
jgi:hypothetical protein